MMLHIYRNIESVVADILNHGEAGAEQEVDGQDAAILHSIIFAHGMGYWDADWLVQLY